jgi:hypothetical protein
MSGERDLATLLASLAPELDPEPYVFVGGLDTIPSGIVPLATFREAEGISLVVLASAWRTTGQPASGAYARLTMMVHSSLEAVGMTAAIAAALTERGISANVVAAYHHDHIFVPWDRRHEAMEAIETLARSSDAAPRKPRP